MHCSHLAGNKGRRRYVRCAPTLLGRSRIVALFFPQRCVREGEEKSESEGLLSGVGQSDAPRQPLSLIIIVWYAMNHLFSLRVMKFVKAVYLGWNVFYFISLLPLGWRLSLSLSLSPPHASSPRCLKLKLFNSRRGLRSRLWWGDGAHTFFWLRCQLPLSLPSLSWLQTGDLTQK